MKAFKMLAKITSKREILMVAALRVFIVSVGTVAGLVGIAYLAKMLGLSKALVITSSVIVGVCGFIFGIYWTMTYLVKSGYAKQK
jgi:positive regulator of sigma E activity